MRTSDYIKHAGDFLVMAMTKLEDGTGWLLSRKWVKAETPEKAEKIRRRQLNNSGENVSKVWHNDRDMKD